MVQQSDLNNTQIETLEVIFEGVQNEEKKKQIDVARALDFDRGYITGIIKDLEELGLIRRTKDGRSNRLSLTDKGCRIVLFSRSSASPKYNNLLHLHKFSVKFPIQNKEEIEERRGKNWREKYVIKTEKETIYDENNDSYIIKDSQYQFRITRNNVMVTISDISGQDPSQLKNRALSNAKKGAKMIEEEFSIKLLEDFKYVQAEVINQHMAVIGDPLSRLVNKSDYEGCQVKIKDCDGNERIWTDDSEGRKDLETGTQFGTHGFSEQDIWTILEHYSWIIQNKDIIKKHRRQLKCKYGNSA